jgi:hypothetical protein
MAMVMNYAGFADLTAKPLSGKAKAQRNNNWAWRPPKEQPKRKTGSGFAKDRLDALCGAVAPKERYAKRWAAK